MALINEFPALPKIENEDWEYFMRRNMQEIVPRLFLGPYAAATKNKFEALREGGITHIVCIRHPIEANLIKPNFPHYFRYLTVDMIDSPTELVMTHFSLVKEFITECLQGNGKVLVHGNGGISRSATIVIAYLMETYGVTYQKAYLYTRQKRSCIHPNEGFVRQLKEYEPIYMAKYQHHTRSGEAMKRSLSDDEEEIRKR